MKKRKKPTKKPAPEASPKPDYDKLRRSAYQLVVLKGHSQKEVAEILGVSEVTMSNWSTEGKWREERKGRMLCHSTDTANSKQLLWLVADKRLELEMQAIEASKAGDKDLEMSIRREAKKLSDEAAAITKQMEKLDKDNRISLGVYIDVMDDIFNALRLANEDLFNLTVDFQALHIRRKTIELG